ncbi:MAG: MarR family transcriptional regulator [Pseudomonadota bacterium]
MTVAKDKTTDTEYVLEDQAGYMMRVAGQRHAVIFQSLAPLNLTPTQFSVVIKLLQLGECSQNELGRKTAMDVATIKGVVDRLRSRKLVQVRPDPADKRRSLIALTEEAKPHEAKFYEAGHKITAETLKPLSASERETFLKLLGKLT